VNEFPDKSLTVSANGKLFCIPCREETSLRKNIITIISVVRNRRQARKN